MKDKTLQIYCVGGAVRDGLLKLPVQDRDWVVVGATPQAMEALGYRPVGKDFPVFLHPETHEEYALARTERKTAMGYKGFAVYAAPDVTLEQDLSRRDFTVNAIAQAQDGSLIDPYHGIADLHAGILRHVSAAFSEDPVRILRAARFVARFGFSIAAGNAGADAGNGGQRRSRCAGGRASVAGTGARPDGKKSLAFYHHPARLRRTAENSAGSGCPVRCTATAAIPSRNRLRHPHHDGAG